MLLRDALTALGLLTRFPVARFQRFDAPPDLASSVWAFPLAGLIVGALTGLVYGLAHGLGAPPLLASIWALAASALVTGALHEDGLADVADGFGGGASRERKLEIMRDGRIGAYGALALILSSLLRVAAIATLADPTRAITALCLSGTLGRAAILVILLLLKPARQDGMAASMVNPPHGRAVAGLAIAGTVALVGLPLPVAALAIGAALVACAAVGAIAFAQIGGYTGDVLGAVEIVAECAVLTVIAGAIA